MVERLADWTGLAEICHAGMFALDWWMVGLYGLVEKVMCDQRDAGPQWGKSDA